MSLEVYKWAKERNGLPGVAKSVLINLADRYNDEKGYAWPSMQRIAEDTGWDRRTVIRAVNQLKGLGLIAVFPQMFERDQSQGPNRYYFPAFGGVPPVGSEFIIFGEFNHKGEWESYEEWE